jgi:hypothetical protein
MTSVATIIDLALKDLGIVGEGQTASGETASDAFTTMNQMLALWQADGLTVYAQKTIVAPLSGSAATTIGAGGTIDEPRPVKIDAAFWRVNGIDYPVTVFAALTDYEGACKGESSDRLTAICYQPTYPLGTIYALPNGAVGELRLVTRIDLPTYIGSDDDIDVPPEYALALRYSLAEQLSSTFATPLRPDVAAMAKRCRKIIKRNNVRIPHAAMPDALMWRGC